MPGTTLLVPSQPFLPFAEDTPLPYALARFGRFTLRRRGYPDSSRAVRPHWARFLERHLTDGESLWVTATRSFPVGKTGMDRAWTWLIREAKRVLGHSVQYARILEPHTGRYSRTANTQHAHGFLIDCAGLQRLAFQEWAWQNIGKTTVELYHAGRGASYYVSKDVRYVSDKSGRGEDFDIRFSPQAPKFRRPVRTEAVELMAGLTAEKVYGTHAFLRSLQGAQAEPESSEPPVEARSRLGNE